MTCIKVTVTTNGRTHTIAKCDNDGMHRMIRTLYHVLDDSMRLTKHGSAYVMTDKGTGEIIAEYRFTETDGS